MSRRLDAQEAALWALVAATVRPLHPRPAQPPASPAAAGPASVARRATPKPDRPESDPRRPGPVRAGPVRAIPPAPPMPVPPRPHGESLDGGWDRRLGSGRVEPDITIDLHGLNREAARHLLYRRVAEAEARGQRVILVITGRGHMPGPAPADMVPGLHIGPSPRGSIKADLPRWLGEEGLTGRIAAVRRAHPRHGGAGAAYLILRRRRA